MNNSKYKDIQPINDKRNAHGYWESYLGDELWYKAFFVNDVYTGYEEFHYYSTNIVGLTFHL